MQFHASFVYVKVFSEPGDNINFMKLKSILAAFAIMASGSLFAQNATKADLDKLANQVNALSQKVAQLETNLERVITENVNLVEQLNVKTVTSCTDKNGIQWDIVKVEPVENEVKITMRINNNTGVEKRVSINSISDNSFAIDTNSNQSVNKYTFSEGHATIVVPNGSSVNCWVSLNRVPVTTSYFSIFQFVYKDVTTGERNILVKFTGIHVPR